ncbi:hypothetical protein VCHA53O466_130032 [Vibrio chagasii]|nr:hypothetical protein VCHA53O466_130032 [Vibrio chagasii]
MGLGLGNTYTWFLNEAIKLEKVSTTFQLDSYDSHSVSHYRVSKLKSKGK